MNIKKIYLLCMLIFSLKPYNPDKIIIFVHEEKPFPWASLILNSSKKKYIKTRWKKVNGYAAEQKGLINITELPITAFSQPHHPIYFTKEKYKTNQIFFFQYNWDGSSQKNDIRKAACRLSKEIRALKKQYPNTTLILIGYSHGGNIIAQSSTLFKRHEEITYETVVLLATPIGKSTEHWLTKKRARGNYIVKEVYVLSSHGDYQQIKDFLFNFPFCSKFIEHRSHGVQNFYVQFRYNDIFQKDSFVYLPNHKNFFYQENLCIKNKQFTLHPIIYHTPSLITKKKQYGEKAKQIPCLTINI